MSKQLHAAVHIAIVGAPVGALVGAAIAGYDYIVNTVLWGHFSEVLPPATLCLLPVAGMLLTGLILQLFRVASPSMADEVVRAYHQPDHGIDYKTAVPKLAASVATMGLGCSAGMEGASKWLGATIASFVQRRLNRVAKLKWMHGKVETTLLAGAAAGIAAIFRAPLTGAIMGIESPFKHDLAHEALIHGLVASATSFAVFSLLRDSQPYFPINFHYVLNFRDLALCVPVGVAAGLASHVFLRCLGRIRRLWAGTWAPRLAKYLVGGLLLSALAYAVYLIMGETATLQAGLPVANRLLNGNYPLQLCLLILAAKLLATALTFGTGGVGGLFVPSATIGAALGAACDAILHPSQPGLFTLVGIAAFTGASYNSLLFAAVFVAEASGSPALVVPGLLASCAAFLVAAGVSNSASQRAHRLDGTEALAGMACKDWMSTQPLSVRPSETLAALAHAAFRGQTFKELPVTTADGVYAGMVSLGDLQHTPPEKWAGTSVTEILERQGQTLSPVASMLEAEKMFLESSWSYLPVVEAPLGKLVGMLAATDVLRARRSVGDEP